MKKLDYISSGKENKINKSFDATFYVKATNKSTLSAEVLTDCGNNRLDSLDIYFYIQHNKVDIIIASLSV